MKYYYPKNLISKPKLALWHVKDILLGSFFFLISIFAYVKLQISIPMIFTIIFMVLKIRSGEQCVFDGIKHILSYLSSKKVIFNTKQRNESKNE